MAGQYIRYPVTGGGGGGGVTTIGAIDSQMPAANGAVISGVNLYLQSASTTAPGLITSGTQTIGGKKTIQTSSTNFVTIDTANPIGINTGPSGIMSIFAGVNGGMAVNMTNTDAGTSATAFFGMGNDLANGRLAVGVSSSTYTGTIAGSIPCADISAWISDSLGGSLFVNDQVGAPFLWAGGTSRVLLMQLDGTPGATTGTFTLTGGHATEKLVINPQSVTWFNQTRSLNNALQLTMQNSSSGSNAYVQMNMNANNGSLFFGHSSTTASFSQVATDQAFLVGSGGNGLTLWAQAVTGYIRLSTGGNHERMRIRETGIVNMLNVPNYANNAAAIAGGLVVGDLYQTSGAVMIVI